MNERGMRLVDPREGIFVSELGVTRSHGACAPIEGFWRYPGAWCGLTSGSACPVSSGATALCCPVVRVWCGVRSASQG